MFLTMWSTIILSLIVCGWSTTYAQEPVCSGFLQQQDSIRYGVHVDQQKGAMQNLRISPVYDSSFLAQSNANTLKNNFVQPAIDFWQNTLQVKWPVSGNLLLDRACVNGQSVYITSGSGVRTSTCTTGCRNSTMCIDVQIPDDYLKQCRTNTSGSIQYSGVSGNGSASSDYILFITAIASTTCANSYQLYAYAASCQVEDAMDRPVAGMINFCPNRLPISNPDVSMSVARHEILHALGFAPASYAFFRDANGAPYTLRDVDTGLPVQGVDQYGYIPSTSVIKNTTRLWVSAAGIYNRSIFSFVTPHVLQEARDHYNCPTLDGVDLENQGGPGSAYAHFEKRHVDDEVMSPSFTKKSYTSRMTLALMEDTGWYVADYTKADNWTWGRNLGCDFVQSSCYEYMTKKIGSNQAVWPFCNDWGTTYRCVSAGDSYGTCNLIRYSSALDPSFQYFKSIPWDSTPQNYGGSSTLADYCPYYTPITYSSGATTGCTNGNNQLAIPLNYLLQAFGSNSICVNQDLGVGWHMTYQGAALVPPNWGAACYQYHCDPTYGLVVTVNNLDYQCKSAGQTIDVSGITGAYFIYGSLTCPSCYDVCNATICQSNVTVLPLSCNSLTRPCPSTTAAPTTMTPVSTAAPTTMSSTSTTAPQPAATPSNVKQTSTTKTLISTSPNSKINSCTMFTFTPGLVSVVLFLCTASALY